MMVSLNSALTQQSEIPLYSKFINSSVRETRAIVKSHPFCTYVPLLLY